MEKKQIGILSLVVLGLLGACGPVKSNEDALKNKVGIEAQEAVRVENENLAARSKALEDNLLRQYRFYKGLRGTFVGQAETSNGTFVVFSRLAPSHNPVPVNYVRPLEDVSLDISKLGIGGEIVVYFKSTGPSAGSRCAVDQIPTDIMAGRLDLLFQCKNSFTISVASTEEDLTKDLFQKVLGENAPVVASELMDGSKNALDGLTVRVFINTLGEEVVLNLKRTEK
jgi:hypothetical protein